MGLPIPKITTSKRSAILTRVQSNPEIGTNNSTFVTNLIDSAVGFIVGYCSLERYPEQIKGFAKSGSTPSTDLSSISTNELFITVNGSAPQKINPVLANCTTGALTAAELQSKIRAESDLAGFDEVTVTYDSTTGSEFYKVESGRFGAESNIKFSFNEDEKHFLKEMKMTTKFGGTEEPGSLLDEMMDEYLINLVEVKYVKMGVEGLAAGGTLGKVNFTLSDLEPHLARSLGRKRRLWRTS